MAGNSAPTNVVIRINDREVVNSFKGINAEVKRLERELKGTTYGTEEFYQKLKELENAQRHLAVVREEVDRNKKAIRESSKEIKSFGDMWALISERAIDSIDMTNMSVKGLGSGIKTMALQAWAAISSIPIAGWIAAAVGALGLAAKEVMDYNVQLQEANKLTSGITKLQGEALDRMTIRSQGFEEVFGFERQKTLEVAKNLVENFGITYDQAMEEIEAGAIRGGAANDEFLDSLKEYPVFFSKAGYSVKDFVNIVNAGFDLGIYSDKLPDALKEFDLSMREQTKSTRDALVNAFGATFSDDILKRVSEGKTSVKDALVEINKESEKYNLTQKQQAQLTADIFRGAGEDVGGFANIMDAVTLAMIDQGGVLTEQQQLVKDQMDRYNELADAKENALKSDAFFAFKRDIENIWNQIQVIWYKWISNLRSQITLVRAFFMTVIQEAQNLPTTFKTVFSSVIKDLSNLGGVLVTFGQMLKSAFTLDADGVEAGFNKLKSSITNVFSNTRNAIANTGKNAGHAFLDNFNKVLENDKAKATAQRILEKQRNETNNFDGSEAAEAARKKAAAEAARKKAAAEKAAKAAEDAAKKTLEARKKDLEESLKAEAEANNRSLEAEIQYRIDKLKLQSDSYQKEKDLADLERSKEFQAQKKQCDDIIATIEDLEKKKAEAKSPEAAKNYEDALKKQRELLNTHDQIVLISEETHQLNLKTIKEKWDLINFEDGVRQNQLDTNQKKRELQDELTSIKDLESAKNLIRKKMSDEYSENEIKNIKTLSEAKKILEEKANQEILKIQLDFLTEQKKNLDVIISQLDPNSPEGKALIEKLSQFSDRISELMSGIKNPKKKGEKKVEEWSDSEKLAMQTDILGFTAEQWTESFDNLDKTEGKLKAVGMAFQALANVGQFYSQLMQAQNERELRQFTKVQEAKKNSLLKQLNEGYITREEYVKATEKLEVEAANKKAEMEYKQAKADKMARMFSVIGNTAMGVASALAAPFPINTWLPWVVSALGAVQLGIVASQPLPEKPKFAKGGFFEGFTGASNYPVDETGERPFADVRLHEKEWVAPRWMTEHPRTAKVIDYLESVRTGKIRLMADGGFSSDNTTTSDTSQTAQTDNTGEYYAIMSDVRYFLKKLYDEGVVAILGEDLKNIRKLAKKLKELEELENKNKH